MKLLDIIFEDENKEKLIKKYRTIYKSLKRGVIGKGHFGKIVYELPDEYDLQFDIHDEAFIKVGGSKSDNGIKFYYVNDNDGEYKPYDLNPTEYKLNVRKIEKKKFDPFGMVLYYEEPYDMDQPLNEDENKVLKKVRAVFKGFKKGLLYTGQNGSKLYYELPDEYKILEHGVIPDNDQEVLFIQVGRETEDNCIKFFRKSKEDENEMVRQDTTNDIYENYKHILNLKLRPFNMRIIFKTRNGKWK